MYSESNQPVVLVVDDTPTNLRLLTQMLRQHDYKTRAVASGEHALESISLSQPDLILLDIMMPGLDGYEVCIRLKADPQTREIPVIFISALDETTDKMRAFAVGGVDYVTKPFQSEEVLARVQTHLDLCNLHRQLEAANEKLRRQNDALAVRNRELQDALAAIKTLSGLVPICAWCGSKIQDESGNWMKVETYIRTHSEAEFTHGICPDCYEVWKPSR